jgi:hypothetical protein
VSDFNYYLLAFLSGMVSSALCDVARYYWYKRKK